jgi:hypothetical protein
MSKYNLNKILGKITFISFYKVGNLNIFVETNVVSKTQIYSKKTLNEFFKTKVEGTILNHVQIPCD